MNQIIRFFVLVISLNIASAILPQKISAQSNYVNYQEFYDQLSPYGQWIENPDYGYVWIPSAGPDFTPYLTNGYWVMTDDGWTWVSNYEWGWAPFHYGRWDFDNSYGWYWVPDNQWGPSWVTWRRSEGYYGWAPMRPGVSITVSFGRSNNVSYNHWNFVRDRDIERHDIDHNYIDRNNNNRIINNSTVVNKTFFDDKRHATYVTGPGREDVQKITGRTIQPVVINERNKPGQSLNNNQLQVYRPQIQNNTNGHKPVPTAITNVKDVRHISGNEAGNQARNINQNENKSGTIKQQPVVNQPNKTNRRDNLTPQRNANQQNINKPQQPVVNPVNRTDVKNQSKPLRMPDPPKQNIRVNRQMQPKIINTPRSNNNTDRQPNVRNATPPRQNNMTPPRQNNMTPPRQNNMTPPRQNNIAQPRQNKIVPPRQNTMAPPKQNSEEPAKSNNTERPPNANDDKKGR